MEVAALCLMSLYLVLSYTFFFFCWKIVSNIRESARKAPNKWAINRKIDPTIATLPRWEQLMPSIASRSGKRRASLLQKTALVQSPTERGAVRDVVWDWGDKKKSHCSTLETAVSQIDGYVLTKIDLFRLLLTVTHRPFFTRLMRKCSASVLLKTTVITLPRRSCRRTSQRYFRRLWYHLAGTFLQWYTCTVCLMLPFGVKDIWTATYSWVVLYTKEKNFLRPYAQVKTLEKTDVRSIDLWEFTLEIIGEEKCPLFEERIRWSKPNMFLRRFHAPFFFLPRARRNGPIRKKRGVWSSSRSRALRKFLVTTLISFSLSPATESEEISRNAFKWHAGRRFSSSCAYAYGLYSAGGWCPSLDDGSC